MPAGREALLARALAAIAAERRRQVVEEGRTPEGDRGRSAGLLRAGNCYYRHAAHDPVPCVELHWPWDEAWWKPKSPERDLVRAGALFQASADAMGEDHHDQIRRRAILRMVDRAAGLLAMLYEDREIVPGALRSAPGPEGE